MKRLIALGGVVTLAVAGCATASEDREISPYAGMTVNERLVVAGLIDDWDVAVKARDRDRMIQILQRVDMGDLAYSTTDAVLANPEKYGF